MGWAFLVDQTIPLAITLTVTFFFVTRKINLKAHLTKLKPHRRLLILIFIIALVTHLGILSYYFWSDEVISMLNPITQNEEFKFHVRGGANMRGYFIASYAFTYLLFGLNVWVYPLFSITYFTISALFVYWFVYLLTNKKTISTLAAVFFATTPAYLDMFTWHSTAHAPILILGLASFILLLYYKKSNRFIYYILSLMFFFTAIKMGFVRSAGFTLVPLLLLFLPLFRQKQTSLYNKISQKPLRLLTYTLPYLATAVYFVLFEFLYLELVITSDILIKTGDFTEAYNFLSAYRNVAENTSLFLPKLLFYTAYLFVPSGLVAETLPFFRPLFPNVSIALTLGTLTLLILFISLLVGMRYRQLKKGWLTIFAVVFIFLNMVYTIIGYQAGSDFDPGSPNFANIIDKRFAYESLGYGPGSRYLFISSVGTSLLFALFVSWLYGKKKIFFALALIFCVVVIGGNTYFTIRSQVQNFKGITLYRSLIDNIFKLVPRDGKPKLLFSANPESNSLDRKFGGWEWLHGFYRKDELLYTTNPQEVQGLVKNGKYTRENVYAFYHNRSTLAFTDISNEVRNHFFSNSENVSQGIPIEFSQRKGESTERYIEKINTTLLGRAVIESSELNKRLMTHQYLRFRLKIQKIAKPSSPFSDTIFIEKEKGYSYNFPLGLWERVALSPQVIDNPGVLRQSNDKSHLQILNILKEQENLRVGTTINVSNIKTGDVITKESLIDGFYTTFPNPRKEERYFVAEGSSIVLIFSFPYKIVARRILLNTPNSYSSSVPKNITILSSLDNKQFSEIKTIENLTPVTWSPNKGKMYQINLERVVNTLFIKLVITPASKTIAFDEVVIDGENALMYTPQEIYETARSAYYYIDSKELFEELAKIRKYDRFTVLWACAEDSDWKQQLKDNRELVPGIWNIAKINIPPGTSEIEDKVALDCYGTKFRKVFFVSPPYPVEMKLIEATLE